MKTLAQFKRDITIGTKIQCNGIEEARILESWSGGNLSNAPYGELQVIPMNIGMQGERTVTKVDTTGFYLSATPENRETWSFCKFPKASELFYDGTVFTITCYTENGYPWQRRHYTIYR